MSSFHNADEKFNLMKFDKKVMFISIRRKIIFVLISSFIALIVGGIYAKISVTPVWRARSTLIRNMKNISMRQDMPYLYQQLDLNTVLSSIRMRKNLQSVIDSLNLETTPDKLFDKIYVERGGRSNLIHITAFHKERDKSVSIANVLAETFIQNYIDILNASTKRVYNYYLPLRDKYLDDLNRYQLAMERFRKQHGVLSIEDETQMKYNHLNDLELKKIENDITIEGLQSQIDEIDLKIAEFPEFVKLGQTVNEVDNSNLKKLYADLEKYQEAYTDKNPKVIKTREEIRELEEKIAAEKEFDKEIIPDIVTYGESPVKQSMMTEKAKFEYQLKSAEELIGDYDVRISKVRADLAELSYLEKEYFELKRKYDLTIRLLEMLENRIVESRIAMESNVSDFAILEPAIPPKFPQASGRKMIALAFGFLTFAGFMIFYILRELFDFRIKSKYDYDNFVDIHFLTEIPNRDMHSDSVFHAQLQILYSQLRKMMPEKMPAFLTIGNSNADSGKSFIVRELSEIFMAKEERVLWIESIDEPDEDIDPYMINKVVYDKKEITPDNMFKISEKLHKCYFVHDDQAFKDVLDTDQLNSFFQQLTDYDIIIWELFEAEQNLQLFTTISGFSDLLTIVTKFRHTNRDHLVNVIDYLKKNTDVPVAGILNEVPKPYFMA